MAKPDLTVEFAWVEDKLVYLKQRLALHDAYAWGLFEHAVQLFNDARRAYDNDFVKEAVQALKDAEETIAPVWEAKKRAKPRVGGGLSGADRGFARLGDDADDDDARYERERAMIRRTLANARKALGHAISCVRHRLWYTALDLVDGVIIQLEDIEEVMKDLDPEVDKHELQDLARVQKSLEGVHRVLASGRDCRSELDSLEGAREQLADVLTNL